MDEQIRILEARLHQLMPMERNAREIYTDLANNCSDSATREQLREIAKDESRHLAMEKEIFELLKSSSCGTSSGR